MRRRKGLLASIDSVQQDRQRSSDVDSSFEIEIELQSQFEFGRGRMASRRRVLSASNNSLHETTILLLTGLFEQAWASDIYSRTENKYSLLLIMMFLFLLFLLILLVMSSAPSSLRTLPEPMFKLPMMTSTILCPLLQISREFFAILELLDGGVPTCFEAREEGSIFGLMAVLGPELVVVG
jgi:hypothetical protein